jgi:hypothetical protein
MKNTKALWIASVVNALFFVWIYTTHVYEITWTIAGVFQELLLIPMLLLAPILVIMSIFLVVKKQDLRISLLSLLISASTTATIAWLFYKDFQNFQ